MPITCTCAAIRLALEEKVERLILNTNTLIAKQVHDSNQTLAQNSITSLGEWQWSEPTDLAQAPNWFVKNSCKGEFWQPLGRGLSHYVENVRLSMSRENSVGIIP